MPDNSHTPTSEAGYDRHDPNVRFLALFGFATLVVLALVIAGLQYYHDRVKEQQIFVKVLAPESSALQALRAREDQELHSYQYLNREKGLVRLPIERAMELVAREYAAGKVFYPTESYAIKKPEPAQQEVARAPAR